MFTMQLEKVNQNSSPQMVVKNGDESHPMVESKTGKCLTPTQLRPFARHLGSGK